MTMYNKCIMVVNNKWMLLIFTWNQNMDLYNRYHIIFILISNVAFLSAVNIKIIQRNVKDYYLGQSFLSSYFLQWYPFHRISFICIHENNYQKRRLMLSTHSSKTGNGCLQILSLFMPQYASKIVTSEFFFSAKLILVKEY